MIWTIAKKEFLLNLMTLKFAVGTVLSLVLMALFTNVLLGDYQQRLESYNQAVAQNADKLREIRVYRNIIDGNTQLTAYHPPEVLSIFSEGMEKQMGNSALIALHSVPELSPMYTEDNPLLSIFPSLDVSLIFKIVLSVLALLLAYDVIAGEKEQGTLRLTLSSTVARHQVLLGKVLAGWMTSAVPITMAFIVVLLILQFSPMVDLGGSEWIRIGLIYVVSLIFVFMMFNFGLLFSCLTRRSSTALMLALFFWVIFVVLIPNASVYLATRFHPVESAEEMDGAMKAAMEYWGKQMQDVWKELPEGGAKMDCPGPTGWFTIAIEPAEIERRGMLHSLQNAVLMKYADHVSEIRRKYTDSLASQKRFVDHLSRSSPIALYGNVMSTLAGTDLGRFQGFTEKARRYRSAVLGYIRAKTDNFSAPSYFSRATEEDIRGYAEAIAAINRGEADRSVLDRWRREAADYSPLDLRDFPHFPRKVERVIESVQRALPDLALLIFANVLLFLLSFTAFLRYDVR